MITYILTLSQNFPAKHPFAGKPTFFKTKLENANVIPFDETNRQSVPDGQPQMKLHTIRANYPLWAKRFEKINRGEACLSVRQWTGKPRHSPQEELFRLTREDGIGLQMIKFAQYSDGKIYMDCAHIEGKDIKGETIARNDGLSYSDWQAWFRNYDLSHPLAIIHFTNFRY